MKKTTKSTKSYRTAFEALRSDSEAVGALFYSGQGTRIAHIGSV